MDSHSQQRSLPLTLPVTPPRQTLQQLSSSTPTPLSTRSQRLQTPPSHVSLPMSLPVSMSLMLPTEPVTTAESHDLFGDHMYYSSGLTGSLGTGMDLNMNMNVDLGMNLEGSMEMDMGMIMDDVDLGAMMHSAFPDNFDSFGGLPQAQTSSCSAQASSSSSTSNSVNMPTATTLHHTTLLSGPEIFDSNNSASPFGDLTTTTSYSSSSYPPLTTSLNHMSSLQTMTPTTTLSYSYPSIYPLPQTTTTAMNMASSSTTTAMAPPMSTTMSNNNNHNSPPLTRSRARNVQGLRSVSDPNLAGEARSHGQGHSRAFSLGNVHTRGAASFDSADEDYFGDASLDTMLANASATPKDDTPLRHSPSINGPPPTDPSDWRARLRYCEQATHKASLDAGLVRLLEFPEGLDQDELEARRAANLRFDRVREQRLKDRNNEAAKRSRQRKVARIEKAELTIASLRRERAQLTNEVQQLKQQLAEVAKTSSTRITKGQGRNTIPSRHGSGSPTGRRRVHVSGSSAENNDEGDSDDSNSKNNKTSRHNGSITIGVLA